MSKYADYRPPSKRRDKRAPANTHTMEYKARLAVQRLDGAWTDMAWNLCQAASIKNKRGGRHQASPLKGAMPLRLEPPSPIGALWTLMALLASSQKRTSAPGEWATLGSEHYSEKAKKHPSEVLPPPFAHAAYLYLFTSRFPPAAQSLGIHTLMEDRDVWYLYKRQYRTGRVTSNPVARALLQSAETFVPPSTWPDYLLRAILENRYTTSFFPRPQRVADVMLMGTPLAPCFVPRQKGETGVSDVTEPTALLLLILIGITPEQIVQAGVPLTVERVKELAATGLSRALRSSRIFWTWFSGVDTRRLECSHLIPDSVHEALEMDAYPAEWTSAIGQILQFHTSQAIHKGEAYPRTIPREEQRAPAGHTWSSLEQAFADPRNDLPQIYARYYLKNKGVNAQYILKADLEHYPENPGSTYGRVEVIKPPNRRIYALSRPETHEILERHALRLESEKPRKY